MKKTNNSILSDGIRAVEIEAKTLLALARSLDDQFVKSVEMIHFGKGRIVVTGVGKSAIIGRKITATFNSTGVPALFMHAADAVHGDFGMLLPDDILLCLSKSGQTDELKSMIPVVHSMGNKIIAIVADKTSFLASNADVVIHTPIAQEAEPNGLAPTSSTIAQLAVGDAMAAALIELRNFKPGDFANLHPAGTLGRRLNLKVKHLLSEHLKPSVSPCDPLSKVIVEISANRMGATAVIDQGKIVGIITDGDLRRMLEKGSNVSSLVADDIMTKAPKCIQCEEKAYTALLMLKDQNITQLLVLSDNTYQGVIHIHDLLKAGLS